MIFFRKLERRFDVYYYHGISRHVGSVNLDVRLTIGKNI